MIQPRDRVLVPPMGRLWTNTDIMRVVERGLHKLVLERNTIMMMYGEVEEKVRDGFAEIFFLDEIEHLTNTVE